VTDVSIPVEGAELAARVSVPAEGPAPAIVVLHGAERGLKDWYLYEHLHDILPPAGVGVVTFDRRGDGASTGEPSRGRFELQAEDALAVIRYAAELPEVESGRIGLWGISQGGWVAPLAATMSPDVAFLVLVASVGVTPGEQMRWTAQFQAGREYGERAAEHADRLWSLVLDWMRGADRAPLETALAEGKEQEWWPKAFLPDELPGDEAREEVRQELDFDPVPVFAAVDVPVLLFYGDQDEWIPVPESIAAWKKARPDADVIVVPGTGHEPAVDEVVDPLYERTMLDWLKRVM
jgi:uncharacterized protein